MLKGASAMTAACAGGGIASVVLADAIGQNTTVELGIVGGICVGIFWAGGTFRGIKDDIRSLKNDVKSVQQGVTKLEQDAKDSRDHHRQLCPLVGCEPRAVEFLKNNQRGKGTQ